MYCESGLASALQACASNRKLTLLYVEDLPFFVPLFGEEA